MLGVGVAVVPPGRVGASGAAVVPPLGLCFPVTVSGGRNLSLPLCADFSVSVLVAPLRFKILSEFVYGVGVDGMIFPLEDTVVNWRAAGLISVLNDSKGLLVPNVEIFEGNTNLSFPLLDPLAEECFRASCDEEGILCFFAARLTTNVRMNVAGNLSILLSVGFLFSNFEASFDAGKPFPPGT